MNKRIGVQRYANIEALIESKDKNDPNDVVVTTAERKIFIWVAGSTETHNGSEIIENIFDSSGRFHSITSEVNESLVIPAPKVTLLPSGINNGNGTDIPTGFVNNNISLNVQYPYGYDAFQRLVETGSVRLVLKHYDTKGKNYSRNIDNSYYYFTYNNKSKFVSHKNGSEDAGDYIFGGAGYFVDTDGSPYPEITGYTELDANVKPNKRIPFIIEAPKFYGNANANNDWSTNPPAVFTMTDIRNDPSYYSIRGEGKKQIFSQVGKVLVPKLTKYFELLFMYKNSNNRWVEGPTSARIKVYVDTVNVKDPLSPSISTKYYYCIRAKIV
jgi:hypothetical protein